MQHTPRVPHCARICNKGSLVNSTSADAHHPMLVVWVFSTFPFASLPFLRILSRSQLSTYLSMCTLRIDSFPDPRQVSPPDDNPDSSLLDSPCPHRRITTTLVHRWLLQLPSHYGSEYPSGPAKTIRGLRVGDKKQNALHSVRSSPPIRPGPTLLGQYTLVYSLDVH